MGEKSDKKPGNPGASPLGRVTRFARGPECRIGASGPETSVLRSKEGGVFLIR